MKCLHGLIMGQIRRDKKADETSYLCSLQHKLHSSDLETAQMPHNDWV